MFSESIPQWLMEAGIGTLLAMFAIKAGYMSYYLQRSWRETRRWRSFYSYENKAAFGMLTVAVGMTTTLFSIWWPIMLRHHGAITRGWAFTPFFVTGVLVSVWGLICLLRALSRYQWSRWVWAALITGAIGFGILSAIL